MNCSDDASGPAWSGAGADWICVIKSLFIESRHDLHITFLKNNLKYSDVQADTL